MFSSLVISKAFSPISAPVMGDSFHFSDIKSPFLLSSCFKVACFGTLERFGLTPGTSLRLSLRIHSLGCGSMTPAYWSSSYQRLSLSFMMLKWSFCVPVSVCCINIWSQNVRQPHFYKFIHIQTQEQLWHWSHKMSRTKHCRSILIEFQDVPCI